MTDLNIESRILDILWRVFAPPGVPLSAATRLHHDLRMDAAEIADLRMELEAEFAVFISDQLLGCFATVGGLVELIEGLKRP